MTPPVDPARYAAFWGVMTVMALTPGPANLFAIATGARRGKAAALAGMAGMNCATLVWFAGAALGLSALIVAFPAAFRLLAWAGAAYVAWLGLKALLAARHAIVDAHAPARSGTSAWSDGFMVQIANPKVLLFFTAVLPPFVDTHRPVGPQLVAYAVATLAMDGLCMTTYGLGGAAIARRMTVPRFRRGFSVFVGLLLLAAAALIAAREI
jgi:threonine/homoserine/homoserine lactone efflux protein